MLGGTKVDEAVTLMSGDTEVRQRAKVSKRAKSYVLRTCLSDKLLSQVGRKRVSLGYNPKWHQLGLVA